MPQALQQSSAQMVRNVDYILNVDHDPNADIVTPTFKVDEYEVFGHYKITCKFIGINSVTKQQFEFEPKEIRLLTIEQSFVENFLDDISLVVQMTPVQLMMLYDNFKELKVNLQFFKCSTKNQNAFSKPVISKTYRAIFKDKADLRKMIPKASLIPSEPNKKTQGHADDFIETEFQLIDDKAYKLRHRSMNYLMRNCTVRDIILNCCSLFGIKKVSFVEPHNKQKYENVIIPPVLSFEQVFQYINEFFGVYNTGFTYYYTEDVLYIYPTYDAEMKSPTCTHFYNVGISQYDGMECYHAVDTDKNYHVVINTPVTFKNLQDEGPDNVGTHFMGLDADYIIDNTSVITEGKDAEHSRNGLGELKVTRLKTYMQASGMDDAGIMFHTYNPKYRFDWNNKYTIPSMLSSYRGSLLSMQWVCAVPYSIKPGYRIYYNYDSEITNKRDQNAYISNNYKYETRSGNCIKASYRLEPVGRYTDYLVFRCTGDLVCFLVPEKVITKEDYDTVSKNNPDAGIIRIP